MPTKIEWTQGPDGKPGESSNPIRAVRRSTGKRGWACVKCGPWCLHCYAEAMNRRFGTGLPYTAEALGDVEFVLAEKELDRLQRLPAGVKCFVMDMGDLFAPFVPQAMRDAVLGAVESNPNATFQLLTKRYREMGECLRARWGDRPPRNVWVGVTWTGDACVETLLATPARIRFVSVEPLLSHVDLRPYLKCEFVKGPEVDLAAKGWLLPANSKKAYAARLRPRLDLVIAGAETGSGKRRCDDAWGLSLRDQCADTGVPFFWKKDGRGNGTLDGVEYHELPE